MPQLKGTELNYDTFYGKKFLNLVMLEAYEGGRYYNLNPKVQIQNKPFIEVVHLIFEEDFAKPRSAEKIAEEFRAYGDFYCQKDT